MGCGRLRFRRVHQAKRDAPNLLSHREPMKIEHLFNDYLLIKKMQAPLEIKRRMLGELFSQWPGAWRVVGVTVKALQRFNEYSFERKSGMGINRSHLVERKNTFDEMLTREMEPLSWWEFYVERDRTVLATSSENMSKTSINFIPISEEGLFLSKGYAWHHGFAEAEKLRALYLAHLSENF